METITSGGLEYDAAWLPCKVVGSQKPDELLVYLQGRDLIQEATFFVDPEIVRVESIPGPEEEVPGSVKVIVLERHPDRWVVEVPGEPISYGPKLVVDPAA